MDTIEQLTRPAVDVVRAAARPATMHFIFHSAFCCSTVLARAFDIPGIAMGLKEPPIYNDIVGWRHRGGGPPGLDHLEADVRGDAPVPPSIPSTTTTSASVMPWL